MLKRDEEEILKVLLKLYEEQGSTKISGTFTDFPVKYQIVYKEILMRLQEQDFITDFEDFIAEDYVLTLLPVAINYFDKNLAKKTVKQEQSGMQAVVGTKQTPGIVLAELESLINLNGSLDKTELTEILEEIKEFCLNLKCAPTVQPRKILMGKIKRLSVKYPWLIEKISKALGLTMMDIMSGN